jgi:hypothetical protein
VAGEILSQLVIMSVIQHNRRRHWLPRHPPHVHPMFVVTEAGAAAIRAAFDQGSELAAAVELDRLFPINDTAWRGRAGGRHDFPCFSSGTSVQGRIVKYVVWSQDPSDHARDRRRDRRHRPVAAG